MSSVLSKQRVLLSKKVKVKHAAMGFGKIPGQNVAYDSGDEADNSPKVKSFVSKSQTTKTTTAQASTINQDAKSLNIISSQSEVSNAVGAANDDFTDGSQDGDENDDDNDNDQDDDDGDDDDDDGSGHEEGGSSNNSDSGDEDNNGSANLGSEDDDSDGSDDEGKSGYKVGGYHPVQIGEIYNDRYIVESKLGWGHFSTVWLVSDMTLPDTHPRKLVALKVQKSASQYTDAALDEIELLNEIKCHNHPGKDHIVILLDSFIIYGPNGKHVCMVFETMGTYI
jgi:serine/threonine-protein kinase SRPK3